MRKAQMKLWIRALAVALAIPFVGATSAAASTTYDELTAETVAHQVAPGRSGYTATILPDGRVLILGGVDAKGRLATSAELFDPATGALQVSAYPGLLARTDHTVTVMTDGRVLITGGIAANGMVLREVEVLDPRTGTIERIDPSLETARFGHFAELLPSSPVLISGGIGGDDREVRTVELYDPVTRGFIEVHPGDVAVLKADAEAKDPAMSGSIPVPDAIDFPIDGVLSVRFSKRLQMASLNADSVMLIGPLGVVKTKVVPTEEGMLVFITPEADLQPGAHYTLFLRGPIDREGAGLPFSAVSFRTAVIAIASPSAPGPGRLPATAAPPAIGASSAGQTANNAATQDPTKKHADEEEEEEWIPGPQHFNGDWRTHRKPPVFAKSNSPAAAPGVTAVSGVVLRLNGKPLVNATLSIGNRSTRTDENGYFLLADVPGGAQTLIIDGKSANRANATYGYFESLVRIVPGRTNELPYTIWIPKLDTAHTIRIPSPTTEEVVLTTPRIPGFEIRIPAGVVLRDRNGKVVTELGITAMPIDRTPYPQPHMDFPVYYTVQPGGTMIQAVGSRKVEPAQLIYPNYTKAAPGAKTNAWLYDPFEKGWYIYGHGTVSADSGRIEMEPGVGLYEFTASAHSFGPNPGGPCGCGGGVGGSAPDSGAAGGWGDGGTGDAGSGDSDEGGDPVSLSSGVFVYGERDLAVKDITPLTVGRVYRHTNPNRGMFGYGWSSPLDWYLWLPGDQTKIVMVMPNGFRAEYNIVSGTGYADGIYRHTGTPGILYSSTLQSAGAAYWRLVLRDGREYNFDVHSPTKLVMFSDRFGNTTRITRDLAGNITRLTGPTGRWLSFSLNADGTVNQVGDVLGRTYSYTYQNGYLQTVTDAEGGVRSYSYDGSNRVRTVTDPRSNVVVTNDYDANNRVSQQTYANSQTMQFAYTVSNGKVTQTDVTNQRGMVRRVTFDSNGFVTVNKYPLGLTEEQTTAYSRDSTSGQVNSITDQLNRVTAFTYDGKGNVLTITRMHGTADAATTTYTYEPYYNQLATVTDPLDHTWTFGFDAARNPTTLTDPLSHITTRAFNSRGQVTSVTDALNHTWAYAYNGADLATVTDPLSRVTTFFADEIGRVRYVKDALGQVSASEYDRMSRLKKAIDPLAGVVEFGFDAAGNMTSHKDQKTNTTSYAFNNLNLVSTKTDALTNAEAYLYGTNGKLSRIDDRKSQVTGITYDNANRVSQVGFGATVGNPTTYTSTVTYTYDGGNRVTQIADSANGTITRTYDGFNRPTQEQTPEGTVSYTYDAASRRATMTVAGQSAVTYTWDNANRLTQIAQGSDSIGFDYDNANRRTSTTLANGVVMTYGYDNANQLTSITYTNGGTTLGDLQYTYDTSGKRTKVGGSFSRVDLPAGIASAVYNANNQLISWAGTTHTYDLNGNVAGDGTNTYGWNARNQLTSISGGISASFGYDGTGRRRTKTIGSTQIGFLYDGLNFVQELNGSAVTANLVTGGIDEVFLRKEGSTARNFLSDALGSIIALGDAAGTLQTTYSYEPYGKTSVTGSANTNAQTFTGREGDTASLMYYRARYYSPVAARFIAEDPIEFDGGANFYNYVENNPVSLNDPSGLLFGWWSSNRRDVGQDAGMAAGGMGNAALVGAGVAGAVVWGGAALGGGGRVAWAVCPAPIKNELMRQGAELALATVLATGAGNGGDPRPGGNMDPSRHPQRSDEFRTDRRDYRGRGGFGRPK